jgi:hypothetical protein
MTSANQMYPGHANHVDSNAPMRRGSTSVAATSTHSATSTTVSTLRERPGRVVSLTSRFQR